MEEGPTDQSFQVPKFAKYINADDPSKHQTVRIVQHATSWTPSQRGLRTSRAGIPDKGLPEQDHLFKETVTLYTSPNRSLVFPYESFNDTEALAEDLKQVATAKGPTATVSGGRLWFGCTASWEDRSHWMPVINRTKAIKGWIVEHSIGL